MEKSKIARLNQLAHKAKNETLSHAETEERDVLRKEYIESFKTDVRATLERVRIQEADGSLTPLKKRTDGAKPHRHQHHDENCSCGCCHREEEEIPQK